MGRDGRVGRAAAQLAEAQVAEAQVAEVGWPSEHPAALDLLVYLCTDERPQIEAMLAALPEEEASRPGARLLRGTCAARGLRLSEALEELPLVVDLARRTPDEQLLAWALSGQSLACALSGRRVESYALLNEAIEIARSIGHDCLLALGLCNLGFLFAQDGRPEPYARNTREAIELFRAIGDSYGETFCLANLGGALVELGALDEAAARLHEGRRRAQAAGWKKIEGICLAGLGALAFRRGHPAIGLLRYTASNRILRDFGELHGDCRQSLLLANQLLDAGWLQGALEQAKGARDTAAIHGFVGLEQAALGTLADVHAAAGDFEAAYRALRRRAAAQDAALEVRIAEAQGVGERLEAERDARRRVAWERERNEALELMNRELSAALAVQRALRDDLERASRTDPLTQLANRRALDETLRWSLFQAARRQQPTSMVLLDLDHFKAVNDNFGHPVGDEVLVELGRRLGARVRRGDLAARWGGEEFCALLTDTGEDGARGFAEALRLAVRGAPFETAAGPVYLTASFGAATAAPGQTDPAELLRLADEALYRAKRAGRDRVEPTAAG